LKKLERKYINVLIIMLESSSRIVDSKLYEVMRYPLLRNSSLPTPVLMSIESNFATLNGLTCNIIQERSVALLEELSVKEAICAIEEFCNRYRWASHKIHRSISGYFRGVCKKYWKTNREVHKLELKMKCSGDKETDMRKIMIIDATVDLLFTKASGLSKELVDCSKRNMLLKFSSSDAIEALYEFCNAAMYREHKIRNMNAYLHNIIKRREAVREARGREIKPQRSPQRLDDNRLLVPEAPTTPLGGRRVRESISSDRSTMCSRVDTVYEREMKQKKIRGKAGFRNPLPSAISIPLEEQRTKQQSSNIPQHINFINTSGTFEHQEDIKNQDSEGNLGYRGAAIKGICVVKSKNYNQSTWPPCKGNQSSEDNKLSVFCRKENPAQTPSPSQTLSMTTESMELSQCQPLHGSVPSSSSTSSGEEELQRKSSDKSGAGEKKTSQACTIYELPILMDHYIISTLSEYIFSY